MSAKRVGGLVCGVILFVVVIAAIRRGASSPAKPEPVTEIPAVTPKLSEPPAASKPASDPVLRRRTLERLQEFYATFKSYQDSIKEAWEGKTDEEKAARGAKLNQLRLETERFQKDLEEQAGQLDPLAWLEFLETPEGQHARFRLVGAIGAAIDLGITAENSASGPLLEGLLPLARGSDQDKLFFLMLAKALNIANRDVGSECCTALEDPNWQTRELALEALSEQASRGNLRETISRIAPTLQKLARESSPESPQVKLNAFQSLTVVETPEMDEFLVQQVEASAEPDPLFLRAEILVESAPRILQSHSHRLAALIKASVDQAAGPRLYQFVRVSIHLPQGVGLEVLRHLASKFPPDLVKPEQGLGLIIQKVERGEAAELAAEMDRLHPLEKSNFFLTTYGTRRPRTIQRK